MSARIDVTGARIALAAFLLAGVGSGGAQAQFTPQMQTSAAASYVMPQTLEMRDQVAVPQAIRPRIPIGEAALDRIKGVTPPTGDAPTLVPRTAADAVPPPLATLTSCQTNAAGGYAPSDIHGAAGPTNIITVTNVDIGVYNKSTCAVVSSVTLKTMFSAAYSIPTAETLFDPRVLYDPSVSRFFVSVESRNSGNTDQYQYFAVSQNSSGTSWYLYRFALSQGATRFCKVAVDSFWDYPNAGYSSSRWYLTANDFPISGGAWGAILSIEKAPSLTGATVVGVCFPNLAANLAPPLVQDGTSVSYFLSPGSGDRK